MEERKSWPFVPRLLVLIALVVGPVWAARDAFDTVTPGVLVVFASTALVVALLTLPAVIRARWLLMPVSILLAMIAWVHWLFFGLYRFSGRGFTADVFAHAEWRSVQLAVANYPWLAFGALLAVVAVLVMACLVTAGLRRRLPRGVAVLALLLALVAMWLSHRALPAWQLHQAWQAWTAPITETLDATAQRRWRGQDWLDPAPLVQAQVLASSGQPPRNLVLIYLESVGLPVVDPPQWPDLMPNLRGLIRQHGLVPSIHASANVTIEGIVNSQCGTLLPMRGGDGLADRDRLAERLPCLGDVLRKAGYRQVYLGGAEMSFAGKGHFLTTHGYDDLRGIEYWRSVGMDQRPGTWGLSDADLFGQASAELERLQAAGQPFNLTVLTIGTHLPGFVYDECRPYPHSDENFLNAMHCTDQLLGAWLDEIRQRGLLANTVLAITADHTIFPNPEMRHLFGDAVNDRRLPLVVIAPDTVATPIVDVGAAYDLAPTLLDLLGVQHNARFILGRSLLSPQARRDYFVHRGFDVHDGLVLPNSGQCDRSAKDGTITGSVKLPLDGCSKAELLSLLDTLAHSSSVDTSRLDCDRHTSVTLDREAALPISMKLAGTEQISRFTFRGRPIAPPGEGLYLLQIDAQGEVLRRDYVPANVELARSHLPEGWPSPWLDQARLVMVAKLSTGDETSLLPSGLPLASGSGSEAIWLFRLPGGMPVGTRVDDGDGGLSIVLSPVECEAALASD